MASGFKTANHYLEWAKRHFEDECREQGLPITQDGFDAFDRLWGPELPPLRCAGPLRDHVPSRKGRDGGEDSEHRQDGLELRPRQRAAPRPPRAR